MKSSELKVDPERVKFLVKKREENEAKYHALADKYNFRFRPQDYKKCVVIVFKTHKKYKINYEKLEEWGNLLEHLSEKYDLYDKDDMFMPCEYRLAKIGIYCHRGSYITWAISDENKEIQEYVLSKLPKWVEVRKKK